MANGDSVRTLAYSVLQEKGEVDYSGQFNFMWIVDFPLFSPPDEDVHDTLYVMVGW